MKLRRGPVLGPSITVAAGVVIAVVPVRFARLLSLIGGGSTLAGFLIGGPVALCGVGAFLRPDFSTEFGVAAMALSVLSLFGAFGGLLVGLILGLVGGGLCLSWKPG